MKTSAVLVLAALICSNGCTYTALPSESGIPVPEGANTIVIKDSKPLVAYYKEVADILFNNGIGIQNSDKELGQITTTPGSFKNGNFFLTILVADGSVMVRGQWCWNQTITLGHVSTSPNDYKAIEYGGQNNSPRMNAWVAMSKVAEQIPGQKEYLRK